MHIHTWIQCPCYRVRGSKRSSRSSSKDKLPAKRTHRQIDLDKIDEEINEGIEENEKAVEMKVLADRRNNKKKAEDRKKTKSKDQKGKKKKKNKSKNSSENESEDDENYEEGDE